MVYKNSNAGRATASAAKEYKRVLGCRAVATPSSLQLSPKKIILITYRTNNLFSSILRLRIRIWLLSEETIILEGGGVLAHRAVGTPSSLQLKRSIPKGRKSKTRKIATRGRIVCF